MIVVPIMMGEFLIERYLGYSRGIMGGNIWIHCSSVESALEAGNRAVEAIEQLPWVITPFDTCSAGSKVETNYPEIGPTTNHPYCPTLKGRIKDSKVGPGVVSIPEIVINGNSLENVKKAMKAAIYSLKSLEGVSLISAGNFGGKLGKYKISLKELILEDY